MPLEGCDVLLGIPWYHKNSAVVDYRARKATLTTEKGISIVLDIKLKGESVPIVSASAISKLMKTSLFVYSIFLKEVSDEDRTNMSTLDTERQDFLHSHADCFSEGLPGELPPVRPEDHTIDLIHGSTPPNRPPYRGTPTTNMWRNASAQTLALHKSPSVGDGSMERKNSQGPALGSSQSFAAGASSGLNLISVIPQLQNLFNQTAVQQELIVNLMSSINPSEQNMEKSTSFRTVGGRALTRSPTMSSVESMGELSLERERDLLTQIGELQNRVTSLVEELQTVKYRNVQLERQLNTIFNKEEEERIRREEAARDDG
ncbi:hypothetical protein L7F22_052239 [Adiantum nelumboides]|nr:hypothetical protein [Adiantum nelumboides]